MAQVVLSLSTQEAEAAEQPRLRLVEGKNGISQEIIFIGLTLATLQILDGLLTGIGVSHFGIAAEGNAFIRWIMESIGHVPALIAVKTLALMIVVLLCSMATRVSWLKNALRAVIVIYLGAAVIPWSYIILTKII